MPVRLPQREHVDRLLSVAAGFAAVCALAVSGYQAYIMRQQLKMSAWPYVNISNNFTREAYERTVLNVGLGPALVRSVTLTVDGRPVRSWREVGVALYGDSLQAVIARDSATIITSTLRQGSVVLPGATVRMFHVAGRAVPGAVQRLFMGGGRTRMQVCFCSLYGDCWTAVSDGREPAPVRACDADPTREFDD